MYQMICSEVMPRYNTDYSRNWATYLHILQTTTSLQLFRLDCWSNSFSENELYWRISTSFNCRLTTSYDTNSLDWTQTVWRPSPHLLSQSAKNFGYVPTELRNSCGIKEPSRIPSMTHAFGWIVIEISDRCKYPVRKNGSARPTPGRSAMMEWVFKPF